MRSVFRAITVWACAVSIAGCAAVPPQPIASTQILPTAVPQPKPGNASTLLVLASAEVGVLERRFPGMATCVAIANLPSRQDFPTLFNYALSAVSNDQRAIGILENVRSSLLRLDAAARKDAKSVELLDTVVGARSDVSRVLRRASALLKQNPDLGDKDLQLLDIDGQMGFGGGDMCVAALKTDFGREAAELVQAWQAFRGYTQEWAASGHQGARSAFVVASAPSVEWLDWQMAEARSRASKAQTAALFGILAIGALAIGLGALGSQGSGGTRADRCVPQGRMPPCLEEDQYRFCVKYDWSIASCER
jgi:hypothetical protein